MLACKSALRWDFPGSAVAVPIAEYKNSSFQEELAAFLEKASIESIKRFGAHTTKAGSFATESRDTVDPALITQMLMTLLEVNGHRVHPLILQKRVRDDVCGSGGDDPWRRCPFWLVLRVAIHRHLIVTLGSDVGRVQYKFLICLTLSHFLDECIGQLEPDLVFFLKTKLCRRIVKLEQDKDKASSQSALYAYLFTALEPDFYSSTNAATKQIDTAWEEFKKRIQRPILTLPKYADPRHLILSLPNSKDYVLGVLSRTVGRYIAPPLTSYYKLEQGCQFSSIAESSAGIFSDRYFRLSEVEMEIEAEMMDPFVEVAGQDKDIQYKKRCIELAGKIENYLSNIGDSYDNNSEAKSIMLLTVMELWVAMDTCASKLFPLLTDYNPGIPSDILDVLQIACLKDMRRLHGIRKYLQSRHAACGGSPMTIFKDPGKGCFGERYYNESGDSRLQSLNCRIKTDAEQARVAKVKEWGEKTLEYGLYFPSILLSQKILILTTKIK